MINPVALKTDLETNVRYDADIRAGNNSKLVELLSEEEIGQTIFIQATVDQVKGAIGSGVRSLSAAQIQTLRFLVDSGGDVVDFSVRAIREELAQIFTGQTAVIDRLTALASHPRTYGEAFGGNPGLEDVRVAVAQITKAHINQ